MALFNSWGGGLTSGDDLQLQVTSTVPEFNQQEAIARLNNAQQQLYSNMLDTAQRNMYFYGVRPMARGEAGPKEKEYAAAEIGRLKTIAQPIEAKDDKKVRGTTDLLKELGFDNLHRHASRIADRAMKENMIALSGYKRISGKAFAEARQRIQQTSQYTLDLLLTPVREYLGQNIEITPGGSVHDQELSLPPADVLEKMAAAKKEGVFDAFSIIHVAKVYDPILVGTVEGSQDLYFIAEWGNDISFDDLK